ncbi:MAG: cbiQ2 [Herbinix sp.]|jgi:cobalt/nickel transport system permease protein|nr:cbiQ2 [Herbinix sp.]
MADIKKTILQLSSMEDYAQSNSPIHRLEPSVKVITTVLFIIIVISFPVYQVSGIIPCILYPFFLINLSDVPLRPLFHRLLIALPFTLFAGLSNLLLDQELSFTILGLGITDGMISFFSIIYKVILTVLSVLLLISTTTMNDLLYVMIRFKVPSVIVIQIMMTYRYLKVLTEEAMIMYQAYLLRAPKEKGIRLKDMGSFLGQLIIRSFDRAERIYQAMKCRGFEGHITFSRPYKISFKGWIYLIVVSFLLIGVRLVNVSEWIGNLFL